MKKLPILLRPLSLTVLSLLIVSLFSRYYLYVNSAQLLKEFKNQNFKEIYSQDTFIVSSRLNSLSGVINWVCIKGYVGNKQFYSIEKSECSTGLTQQEQRLVIPEANNFEIIFTTKLPKEIEYLFSIFFIFQTLLIAALIYSTKRTEMEKHFFEMKINKLARQMSHDIRSPLATLNTVIKNINFLEEKEKELIQNSIHRINSISNKLLNQSSTNKTFFQEDPVPEFKEVDVRKEIEEVVMEKNAQNHQGVNIHMCTTDSLENFNCIIDAIEFKRIMSNLITNSYEARINDYHKINIHINLKRIDSNVLIEIIDDGSGMSPDTVDQIGKKEFSTKNSGNGLGLKHTFETLNLWQAKIEISSELKKGTKISILLLASDKKSKKEILIDNDELVRITWGYSAKKNKIELITFSSQDEMFKLIDSFDKYSNFYIDSDLGDGIKGEEVALRLNKLGFMNLYITSGHNKDHFKQYKFLLGVKDKSPPW